jgi:hypothetical protein
MKPGDAEKAFDVAVRKVGVERIMAGLQNQIESGMLPAFSREGENITPYPATWLRSASWDNEIVNSKGRAAAPDPRPTKFKVQPIIDPATGEELEPVRTLEYDNFDAMQAAMKAMQVDRKDDNAGYWLFTEAGYAQQLEAARKKRGLFTGLVRRI